MTIAVSTSITNDMPDVYKRILRQKGEHEHIDKLVAAVSSRFQSALNTNFMALGYEIKWRVDGTSKSFDFRNLKETTLFGFRMDNGKTPAAMCVVPEQGSMLVDMMLGSDPELESEATAPKLTEFQESILIEFGNLMAATIESVLELSSRLSLDKMTGQATQNGLGDHASFAMTVQHGDQSYTFEILLSQSAILKLNFREKAPEPIRENKGNITPEKDVDIEIFGIVHLSEMTLRDVAKLKPGAVLALGDNKNCQTTLSSKGRKLHKCQLGQDENSYALLVEEAHEPIQSIITSAV
ncbi:FliM/FliN family flagellar motor switch protein [Ahrensia kielensis]|jgi:flagellar motor switch protein FliM|uniref:FliM/FliN family flagellar motor switch protein n=1 Tax=Ahrensia kielensis TaxID=76980 RepID=UPI000370896A|nr:FliM/FliN family flagellar motor switch protein [Ahrensia kielensis]